ncbi:hypothetical protein J2X84_002922 [Pseudomonas corrugata]|jgi:hypothetical protein|nr:hypothetical protein [Pseudomonas corrugata]
MGGICVGNKSPGGLYWLHLEQAEPSLHNGFALCLITPFRQKSIGAITQGYRRIRISDYPLPRALAKVAPSNAGTRSRAALRSDLTITRSRQRKELYS